MELTVLLISALNGLQTQVFTTLAAAVSSDSRLHWLQQLLQTLPASWDARRPLLRFAWHLAFPSVLVGGLFKDPDKVKQVINQLLQLSVDRPVPQSIYLDLLNRFPTLAALCTHLNLMNPAARLPGWLREVLGNIRDLIYDSAIEAPDAWISVPQQGTPHDDAQSPGYITHSDALF